MARSRAVWAGGALVWFVLCGSAVAEGEDAGLAAALTLSAVVAEPSETGATVSYSTNLPASGMVEYGPTEAYEHGAIVDARLAKEHSLRIVGLAPGTRYHYRTSVTDPAGHTVDSGDKTFTTTSIDTTPPVIAHLATAASAGGAVITWETDEPTTGSVVYGQSEAYESGVATDPREGLRHRVRVRGLEAGAEYLFRLVASDRSGNTAEALHGFSIAPSAGAGDRPDITPPTIFNLNIVADSTGATVSWETDEPATSEVTFGRSRAYGAGRVTEGNLVRWHTVRLRGVVPGVRYHYRVATSDGSGNAGRSPDLTFTTPAEPALAQAGKRR